MTDGARRTPKFPLRLDQMSVAKQKAASAPPAREVLRPQQPLQHAAATSARKAMPTGLGLDSAGVRRRMVERLRQDGLRHEAVLAAIAHVPRHLFVDAALATQAYEDTSLPIGHGQTISKPSVVGRMIELLMGGANARTSGQPARVLEIGTGCGYQAAVLARLARQVYSVERVKPLHDKARELMAPLRIGNVRLVYGDGMLGHPPNAPYDAIIAAAGGESLPAAWIEQLAVGGRIVAPVSDNGVRQVLVVVDRTEQGCERSVHEVVQFVPLKSGLVR
ncbi:protein-L-isoaspartate(D-aspartate) O-methyltransferase [Piscinibacter sp.]|uniref:protein-L-isoaspartate(D-aspartate) O-methyltransferase n=1 Tax=Piscinibacter sp. TaxID=1903157 RepID=UPI002C3708C0|nr:protein-L-isoaspartate(D-aspartate) O-methyltransferase [Albitalea sp.]HUG25862.1 protein-L-isoaspartate(D-aspartate) O-methyltransferase [Albitalea sp.]